MDFDTKTSVKTIVTDLQRYVEKRIELKTLEFQEKGAALAAAVISNGMGLIMMVLGLFFLLVAAGIGLGYLFDNMMLGFVAVALILIIFGFYIYKTSRNALQNKLQLQLNLFVDSVLESAERKKESIDKTALNPDDENQSSTDSESPKV
ncbi:MAG: phage holin family protein [Balneolia bacterium]|nr:phage holin family protein [Balneolia bacterium]